MANLTSPLTTYSDTSPHKRVITDFLSLIDPSDAPLVNALGGLDGASSKFRFVNAPGKVVEWLEDTLIPIASTLNQDATLTSTIASIYVADGTIFQEGQIVKVNTELMWVSAVSTNTLTVTRGVAGSTAATQASLAAIYVVGMARLEGDDSDDISFTDRTVGSNYTSIFHQEVKVSRTQREISQYGIADEMRYQVDKVVPTLMRLVERMLFESKAAAAGSATTPRIFGGIQAFATTNLLSGTSLAQSQFENAVMSCYAAGGTGPWIAPVAPANLQKIKNFYDATTVLRVDRTETTVGMEITKIQTPFGLVNLLLDRWTPTTIIPLISTEHAGMLTLYPFTEEPLAKTGDADKSEVVGEFTFCMRQNAAHAILTNVS